MKGLLIKDFYCLRNQLRFFFFITLGVVLVSIMFILSSKYGNVAVVVTNMQKDPKQEFLTAYLYDVVLILNLFIPMALGERVTECFVLDHKSAFGKVLFILPVSNYRKVGSRYIAALLYILLGMSCSFMAGIITSIFVGSYTFSMILRIIITLMAVMVIFMSAVLCLNFYVGGQKSPAVANVVYLSVLVVGYVSFVLQFEKMSENEMQQFFHKVSEGFHSYLEHASWEIAVLALVAFLCLGLSYILSVKAIGRKRGTI